MRFKRLSGNLLLLSERPLHRRSGACLQRRLFTSSESVDPEAHDKTQHPRDQHAKTADFGFETVAESFKAARVKKVFSSVATSYDSMNDFMSLGIHRLWKDQFVRGLDPGLALKHDASSGSRGWKILDVAGGTGDIAFRMLEHASRQHRDCSTHVTISDINAEMLAEGRKRSERLGWSSSGQLNFIQADAENLHGFASNSMDLYTVAFGIRNFTNKSDALKEAFRVLRPGGLFACLEFSKVDNTLLNAIYKRWSFGAIPLIGQLVAGDRQSYQYLVESIERFPTQQQFRDLVQDAGFITPTPAFQNLNGGIAAIHKGIKPLQ